MAATDCIHCGAKGHLADDHPSTTVYEVEFSRASAPQRIWSKRRFPARAAARRAARNSVGRVMGGSGTVIVEARVYERTQIASYR